MPLGEHADRLTNLFPYVNCLGDLEDRQSHSLKSDLLLSFGNNVGGLIPKGYATEGRLLTGIFSLFNRKNLSIRFRGSYDMIILYPVDYNSLTCDYSSTEIS